MITFSYVKLRSTDYGGSNPHRWGYLFTAFLRPFSLHLQFSSIPSIFLHGLLNLLGYSSKSQNFCRLPLAVASGPLGRQVMYFSDPSLGLWGVSLTFCLATTVAVVVTFWMPSNPTFHHHSPSGVFGPPCRSLYIKSS